MSTKAVIAGILAGIVSFFLGWLIWGILLKDMMAEMSNGTCMKAEADMNMPLIAASSLVWGLLYAYIMSKWANISTIQGGAIAGATLSFGIALSIDLMFYATTTMMSSMTGIIVDVLANIVMGAVMGAVIGWWLGRK